MRGFASAFFGHSTTDARLPADGAFTTRLLAVYRREHASTASDEPQFVGHSVAWPARRTMMSPEYLDTFGKGRNAGDNRASLSGELGGLAARLNSMTEHPEEWPAPFPHVNV